VAAEYGLLLALVALAIVAAVTLFGSQVVRLIQTGADAF
jgi:Flp pilus assembly pilin Flp